MKTLQPTKRNDMVAINNDSKVSKNERTTNEDKNKQIRQQIKIQNEHLGNINKIEKLKKKTGQCFYDETLSRTQPHFGESSIKHPQIQQISKKRN